MPHQLMQEILSQITKRNQNVVAGTIHDMQSIWKSWYRGNVNNFHRYNLNVQGRQVSFQRLSMQMAKKVCEDWQSLLFNEKVEITVKDKTINDLLHEVLNDNNFVESESSFVEKSFALGTGATIEYVANGKTKIDFIDGDLLVVSGHDNGIATMITTISIFAKGKKFFTHLTYHDFVDDTYLIEHELFASDDSKSIGTSSPADISILFTDEELDQITRTDEDGNVRFIIVYEDVKRPLFQILKPNIANNYDTESPMGISIFANSIDTLRAIDMKYDGYTDTFQTNKTRIFVKGQALKKSQVDMQDSDGNSDVQFIQYFDRNDTTIQGLEMDFDDDGNLPIKATSFTIPEEQYRNGINAELGYLSSKNGFGANWYNFNGTITQKTATEVVHENKEAHKNKIKHQLILERQIEGLCRGVLFLEQQAGVIASTVDIDTIEIDISFDDSIIIDDEAERVKDEKAVENGLMPKVIFLEKWYNLTPEEAKQWLELSSEESQQAQEDFFGNPEDEENEQEKETEEEVD